jgi:hypothetical protein
MTKRAFVAVLLASITIVTGCAGMGPGAGLTSGPVSATFAPDSDLSGTWHGSFGWVGGTFYTDEGVCVLRINNDGTFTETIVPGKSSNNLAKRSNWSGTVVTRGNRVTFRTSQGPSFTLVRAGNTLYGLAEDPVMEFPIMMRFERDGGGS